MVPNRDWNEADMRTNKPASHRQTATQRLQAALSTSQFKTYSACSELETSTRRDPGRSASPGSAPSSSATTESLTSGPSRASGGRSTQPLHTSRRGLRPPSSLTKRQGSDNARQKIWSRKSCPRSRRFRPESGRSWLDGGFRSATDHSRSSTPTSTAAMSSSTPTTTSCP